MEYYVYILSNKMNTAIYTGITRDLIRRIYEHKHHVDPNSYTAKYDITKLVYYESTADVNSAIEREKQIKGWNRKRKKQAGGKQESFLDRIVRFHTALGGTDCHTSVRAGSQ